MYAASTGHLEIVTYLLKNGAKVDPLVTTSEAHGGTPALFQIFLDNGWDVNSTGDTRGTEMPTLIRGINNALLIQWVLEHGASPNVRSSTIGGWTALEYAACYSTPEVIALLLDSGATIEPSNALHLAARGRSKAERELQPRGLPIDDSALLPTMNFLLDRGANINTIEDPGEPTAHVAAAAMRARKVGLTVTRDLGTPLHEAAKYGMLERARLLLQRGADPSIRSAQGKTALDWAQKHGHPQMVDLLRSRQRPVK
ncbi:hypothetical protein LTR66_009230 [Elasticomyces elasticus]|nr:hypothetical protein LTR66_009230 [Elasticomyces elasticus]